MPHLTEIILFGRDAVVRPNQRDGAKRGCRRESPLDASATSLLGLAEPTLHLALGKQSPPAREPDVQCQITKRALGRGVAELLVGCRRLDSVQVELSRGFQG